MNSEHYISIIIPTYNRAGYLWRTLDSFLQQSYSGNLFEIIIANNNSTDTTEEVAKRYVQDFPGRVKYIQEHRQGAHFARNAAARIAKGDILYFTDDDMLADRVLISEIVKVFSFDSKVASVTGRILPKWEIEPPDWVLKLCYNGWLGINDPFEDFIISPNDCNVWSGHLAVRKDIFFQCGGFNPDYLTGELIGDGETGLNIKIKELGYWFGFNGASITYHIIPAERMTQRFLNRRLANQGKSASYTEYKEHRFSRQRLIIRILEHSVRFVLEEIKFLVDFTLKKVVWHIHLAYTCYFFGRISYDWRLATDGKWRALVLKRDWLSD